MSNEPNYKAEIDKLHKSAYLPKGAFIAGGAVTSVFTNQPINDVDVYFKSREHFEGAIESAYEDGFWCCDVSKRSVTFKDGDTIIQYMHFDFFPTADDIFKAFDFTVCMGAYDLDYLLPKASTRPMTPEEAREQRISFVFGNVGTSNPSVTRKMVEDAVDGVRASPPAPRIGSWIQTYSGRQAYPMDLRPSEVHIEDIAHSLSLQCRYTGHCRRFYSVAEHSVLMARHFIANGMREYALPALLHDATEAYLTDVPRPVKPFMIGYREAEARAWAAIAERFGLAVELSAHVHDADARILVDERAQNMAPSDVEWEGMPTEGLGVTLQCWPPSMAERVFLATYWELVETGRM